MFSVLRFTAAVKLLGVSIPVLCILRVTFYVGHEVLVGIFNSGGLPGMIIVAYKYV